MKRAEQDFRDYIFADLPLDNEQQETARREIVDQFDYTRKKLVIRVTLWVLLCIGFMFAGAWWLAGAGDTKTMLIAFFIMMVGLESSVLIKLWFWVVDSRNVITKETRLVQLQLATLAQLPANDEPQSADEQGGSRHDNA